MYCNDFSSAGKYGFAERIIDGIYMSINSVIVNFKAPAFHASIQVYNVLTQNFISLTIKQQYPFQAKKFFSVVENTCIK